MINLVGYTFPENQTLIVCTHVWDGSPVLLFSHHSDGDIQLLCGEHGHSPADALVVGLAEISGHLHLMQDIPTVDPGYRAVRSRIGGGWSIRGAGD